MATGMITTMVQAVPSFRLGKETPGAGGHRSKFAAYTAIVVIKRCCYLSHSTPLNPAIGSWPLALSSCCAPKNLAGAEGFEPPSPVLETGSLAVELTPLFGIE